MTDEEAFNVGEVLGKYMALVVSLRFENQLLKDRLEWAESRLKEVHYDFEVPDGIH